MIQADDKIPWSTLTIDGVTEKYNRDDQELDMDNTNWASEKGQVHEEDVRRRVDYDAMSASPYMKSETSRIQIDTARNERRRDKNQHWIHQIQLQSF
jgi:hypothetical protein